MHRDAANTGAGGLHLVGDDRHLGPDHLVDQGRLAGIRLADQGDKARAVRAFSARGCILRHACPFVIRAKSVRAASCSACRFDPARAVSVAPSSSVTRTVKTG